MHVVYSPRYAIDLGLHVFPTVKYRMVHARLLEARIVDAADVIEPEPATWRELALVHTPEYLARMRDGTLTSEDIAQLELPWSEAMVDGFRVMVGGTIKAALIACDRSHADQTQRPLSTQRPNVSADFASPAFNVVCHIGGGLHHAFPNHGEGFCPFNDVAVAVRVVQARGIERVAIVDLDVHHGNGTAFIFNPRGAPPPRGEDLSTARGAPPPLATAAGARLEPRLSTSADADANVFTFSMHQQYNYPMWKPRGSLDIGLPDGVHDAAFLKELERGLLAVRASRPRCVFYLAGADPYEDDQLGGLRLTKDGLRARDRMVIDAVRAAGVPLVITLAGGYGRRVEDTVEIHVATIEEAARAAADPMSGRIV